MVLAILYAFFMNFKINKIDKKENQSYIAIFTNLLRTHNP